MYHLFLNINKIVFSISLEYTIDILAFHFLIILLKNSRMAGLHALVIFRYNEGKRQPDIRERESCVQPTVS